MKHTDNEFEQEMFCKCPYVTAQKVLSGKWAILILCYLKNGPLRFNELCKYLKGLTQATLTKQLRRLEEDKLIVRTVFPVVSEYSVAPAPFAASTLSSSGPAVATTKSPAN